MERAEQGVVQDMKERLQSAAQEFDTNPQMTRRAAIAGMLSSSILLGLNGLKAVSYFSHDRSEVNGSVDQTEACLEDFSACQDEPLAFFTNEEANNSQTALSDSEAAIPLPTEPAASTPPPVPTTNVPAVAVQPTASFAQTPVSGVALAQHQKTAGCQYEVLSTHECITPAKPPEQLPFQRFDTDDPAEINQINTLLGAIVLSPDRFESFKIDTSHASDLEEILSRKPTWPTMSVNHWVGYSDEDMSDDITVYLERMKHSHLSYHDMVMANGYTYLIAPTLHDLIGHAKYANWESSGTAANANSVYTLTPEMLEAMIYIELWSDKEYGRAMTRENSRSHAEVVRHDNKKKVDWPSQLQDRFYQLKLGLNHQVYVEGKGGHPSPFAA